MDLVHVLQHWSIAFMAYVSELDARSEKKPLLAACLTTTIFWVTECSREAEFE